MVGSIGQEHRRKGSKGGTELQFYHLGKVDTCRGLGLGKICADQEDLGKMSKQDSINIVGLLKACANQKDLASGCKLHAYVQDHKFLKNCFIANTLVSMYAKCGALAKARQLVEVLPVRNVVTWTALIAGYVEQGQGDEALNCYDAMQCDGHQPNMVTFTCALKACGSIGAAAKGEEIHERIISSGMLEKSIALGSALVDMYARCGALARAQQVIEELPVRNVVTWTALIAGYAHQGQGQEALRCFCNMQLDGHSPDESTFTCALKACGSIRAAAKGKQIHDQIVSLGILEKNVVLGGALVDMYARCGAVAMAQQVIEELSVQCAYMDCIDSRL